MAVQDLNDFRFFVDVVEQNGFAAAARKLHGAAEHFDEIA